MIFRFLLHELGRTDTCLDEKKRSYRQSYGRERFSSKLREHLFELLPVWKELNLIAVAYSTVLTKNDQLLLWVVMKTPIKGLRCPEKDLDYLE